MTAYIGFQALDQFAAALDHEHQVYVAPLSIVKTNNEHISTCTVSPVASQPQHDSLIYCKVDVSRWQELYGKPFGQEAEQRAARAEHLQEKMWTLIVEALRADNPDLEIYDGAPSFPDNLILIPGHIEGIAYDAELQDFIAEHNHVDH